MYRLDDEDVADDEVANRPRLVLDDDADLVEDDADVVDEIAATGVRQAAVAGAAGTNSPTAAPVPQTAATAQTADAQANVLLRPRPQRTIKKPACYEA